jgi:hypothetical protein
MPRNLPVRGVAHFATHQSLNSLAAGETALVANPIMTLDQVPISLLKQVATGFDQELATSPG